MFQWTEKYRIDGGTVDRDHQYLFELANRMISIVDPVEQTVSVKKAVRELHQYIGYHFNHEQELMREASYPEYEEHTQKHKQIIHEMNAILKNCHEVKLLVAELRQLMVKWVAAHVMEDDKKFGSYIKKQIGVG